MPPPPGSWYSANIFGIPSHNQVCAANSDSGIFPECHSNYIVQNIGRAGVHAKLKCGTKVMWHGDVTTAFVEPGEKVVLTPGIRSYYVTGLKLYNETDYRAVVHVARGRDGIYTQYATREPGAFDELKNEVLKLVLALGVKHVPYVEAGLSGLLSAFWPENKSSPWNEVLDQLRALVNETIFQTTSGILDGDLRLYQERISALAQEVRDGIPKEVLRDHYMNIAQDLVEFEHKFIMGKDIPDYQEANHFILPLYSMCVLMKISFYAIGIQRQDEMGLDYENIKILKSYGDGTIHVENGANNYITKLYDEQVDQAYATGYPEDLYDIIMNVRSYIATQGLEYIPIWNHMLENPKGDTDMYNDVISYSTFYGRQTPNLIRMAIPDEVPEPLNPVLINGRRNRITYVEVYMWRISRGRGPPKIGGMKIHFENDDAYTLGTRSGEIQRIDFNDALLNKFEVFGDGALDYFVFHFSDGRTLTCGTKEIPQNPNYVFELKDHHIVSFYLSSDIFILGGQAANISVAYQLIDKTRGAVGVPVQD